MNIKVSYSYKAEQKDMGKILNIVIEGRCTSSTKTASHILKSLIQAKQLRSKKGKHSR